MDIRECGLSSKSGSQFQFIWGLNWISIKLMKNWNENSSRLSSTTRFQSEVNFLNSTLCSNDSSFCLMEVKGLLLLHQEASDRETPSPFLCSSYAMKFFVVLLIENWMEVILAKFRL